MGWSATGYLGTISKAGPFTGIHGSRFEDVQVAVYGRTWHSPQTLFSPEERELEITSQKIDDFSLIGADGVCIPSPAATANLAAELTALAAQIANDVTHPDKEIDFVNDDERFDVEPPDFDEWRERHVFGRA